MSEHHESCVSRGGYACDCKPRRDSFHSTPASEALVRDIRKRESAAERARIVAWLRVDEFNAGRDVRRLVPKTDLGHLADAIERVEHEEKT